MPPMRSMNVPFSSERQKYDSHDMEISGPVTSSVCDEVEHFPSYEEEAVMNQDGLKYIPWTASQRTTNKQRNSFKCVMESMRQFSASKSFDEAQSSDSEASNHKTIVCAHENDDSNQSTASSPHKMYRSHTKIESIPHGVRIITEILKQDNNGEDCEEAKTKTEGNRINKKIEVIVEEDDDEDDAEN